MRVSHECLTFIHDMPKKKGSDGWEEVKGGGGGKKKKGTQRKHAT